MNGKSVTNRFSAVMLLCCMVLTGIGSVLQAQLISTREPLGAHAQILLHLDQLEDTWEIRQARAASERKGSAPGIGAENPLPGEMKLSMQLKLIQGRMNFGLFPKVREFIRLYARQKPQSTSAVMGLSKSYFPIIEKRLRELGMPQNLKYLPVALSGLNTRAVAEHGTSGLWQLHYHAALRYGLNCDAKIDERRDIHRSTEAALTYLGDLFKKYRDWTLAVTAFIVGPGSMTRAHNRIDTRLKPTFETLYPHLPPAYRDYLPAFVAVAYVMNYHEHLGLTPLVVNMPPVPDRLALEKPVGFAAISKVLHIPEGQVRAMNPVCRTEIVPGVGAVRLCLPSGFGKRFEALEDSIYRVHARNTDPPKVIKAEKPENKPEVTKSALTPTLTLKSSPPAGTKKVEYTIQSGDNLGRIAATHGVGIDDLKAWNGLENDYIRAGDRLAIYLSPAKADEIDTSGGKPVARDDDDCDYYTVKSGDTLWGIAQGFPGVSDSDIMKYNNITEAIQPGQRLKIPRVQK